MTTNSNRSKNRDTQGWEQFLSYRKIMLDKFDTAKAQDKIHKTQTYRGKAAESEFRNWLESFLPKKYGVTSGYIISQGLKDDIKAPHFDVIIYDQLESPILWVEENPDASLKGMSRAIPAEYVRAVIEVKSSLNLKSIKQSVKHLFELKPLLTNMDEPEDRYKIYLPQNFFFTIVFFEILRIQKNNIGSLSHLFQLFEMRHFYLPFILRGEGFADVVSCKFIAALDTNKNVADEINKPPSIINSGLMPYGYRIGDEQYLRFFMHWSINNFSRFAFDLVALLNNTYDSRKLSSFHGIVL